MAMALHYIHTLWNAVSAGDVVMDGCCTIYCDVLSGGDLPHKGHLLTAECPCIHESDCSLHNTSECTIAYAY